MLVSEPTVSEPTVSLEPLSQRSARRAQIERYVQAVRDCAGPAKSSVTDEAGTARSANHMPQGLVARRLTVTDTGRT